jgi:hypothetical protein
VIDKMASSIEAVNNDVILHSQKAQQVNSAGAKGKKTKVVTFFLFFSHIELSCAVSGFGQWFGNSVAGLSLLVAGSRAKTGSSHQQRNVRAGFPLPKPGFHNGTSRLV